MKELRMLSSQLGASGNLRAVTYRGRPHYAVNAVGLLGNIVVSGLYSLGPEFVPAEVLIAAARSFDGRPIFTYHPSDGGNDPSTISRDSFGQVFNAEYSGGALQFDCFLDPVAAGEVGDEAAGVVKTIVVDGGMVEVSIAGWVELAARRGISPVGEPYEYVWLSCQGSHVGLGLAVHGGRAACDISRGCGVNRSLSATTGVQSMCDNANCSCQHIPPDPCGVPPALARALGLKPTAAERVPTAASLAAALRLAGPGSTFIDGVVRDVGKVPSGYATAGLVYRRPNFLD